MGNTIAILVTMTTYGTWLRGDQRGWVDEGILMPPDPNLELADRLRLRHEEFRFSAGDLLPIGDWIGSSLRTRLRQRVLALTVQTWHVHLVVGASPHAVSRVVKCAKDAVRWGLRLSRPIWTDGYDKRFCFDDESLRNRIEYVERHNTALGWPAKPWPFIETPDI